MCITVIRVPALAKAEQHCYRACYAACVALVATSRPETCHMLSVSQKTLQRAYSETVNSRTGYSVCVSIPQTAPALEGLHTHPPHRPRPPKFVFPTKPIPTTNTLNKHTQQTHATCSFVLSHPPHRTHIHPNSFPDRQRTVYAPASLHLM